MRISNILDVHIYYLFVGFLTSFTRLIFLLSLFIAIAPVSHGCIVETKVFLYYNMNVIYKFDLNYSTYLNKRIKIYMHLQTTLALSPRR
jgi:hypothetical protein